MAYTPGSTVSSILTTVPRIYSCVEKPQDRSEYRALIVAALMAGDMSSWIGPGRRVLDCVWKVSGTFEDRNRLLKRGRRTLWRGCVFRQYCQN
jgi:hypothetical protein